MVTKYQRFAFRLAVAITVAGGSHSCVRQNKVSVAGRQQDVASSTRADSREPTPEPVTPKPYLSHIEYLASDQLEGRGTGSRGIDLAAGYIAGQFEAIGLSPGGDSASYFQNFTIPSDPKISSLTHLSVKGDPPPRLILKTDFVPLGSSSEGDFEGDVVFAGYGLTNSGKDYDDYANLDVKGKIVIAFRGQPPALSGDGQPRERTLFDRKIGRASELGANAILFVSTAPATNESDTLIPFGRRGRPGALPAMHISRTTADRLMSIAHWPSLTDLQASCDRGERVAGALPGVSMAGGVTVEREDWPARNVIGVLPGRGPLSSQIVVLGAHYDHLGIREGTIYNGADDNASGSAGVIEVCKQLAKVPVRKRTLLCMTFTGEEIGLLGSEHYVEHPTVPIQSIVAMVNMDMIGRWTPGIEENELAVQGLGTGDSLAQIVQRRADQSGIKFLPDPSAKGPSDHASFYEAGVPSLFFFTGVHADYHRPGDDVEKINADGAAKIATMVSQITLDLINAESTPQFAKVESTPRIFRGPQPSPVVMGIMPDMEGDSKEPGWLVADVMEGGGASKAGMKAGDRILSVDGLAITGMTDYYKATEKKKAGDVISVNVRRGREELTLQVELAARK